MPIPNANNYRGSVKRLVILATAHEVQLAGHPLNHDLGIRVEYLCRAFNIHLVMEEWTKSKRSFLEGFARAKTALTWEDVGTPAGEEFSTYRCPPLNHPGHDGTLPPDQDAPSMAEYGPYRQQEKREIQMVENICAKMEQHASGLVVVGVAHLHSLLTKLRNRNFEVVGYVWTR